LSGFMVIHLSLPLTSVQAVAVSEKQGAGQENKASPSTGAQQQNTISTQNRVQSSSESEPIQTLNQQQTQDVPPQTITSSVSVEEMGKNMHRLSLQHAIRLEYRFAYYEHRLSQIARKLQARLQIMQQDNPKVSSLIKANENHLVLIQECAQMAQSAVGFFREVKPDPMNQGQTRLIAKGKDQAQKTRACFQSVLDSMTQTAVQAQKIQTPTQ